MSHGGRTSLDLRSKNRAARRCAALVNPSGRDAGGLLGAAERVTSQGPIDGQDVVAGCGEVVGELHVGAAGVGATSRPLRLARLS